MKERQTRTKKKITVLRTIESFYPVMSGPANQASRISKELEKRGLNSPVLTSNYKAEKSPAREKMDGVDVYRFPIKWRFMKYFYTPEMKKMLSDFDVVHAHSCRSYQTEIAYKMAKYAGKPFVISTHGSMLGYDHYLKGPAKTPYIIYDIIRGKKIVRKADAVIVNSKEEYQDAINYGVRKDRIHLIPVGIDIDNHTKKPKSNEMLNILFVGRISRNRNVEPIIKAAAILKRQIPEKKMRFRIVGGEEKSSDTSKGGYLQELKDLAEKLKVTDIIEFTGPKYDDALRNEYISAHMFVYTSLSENFGQTILEAAASGLPIICTKVGIAPEIIEDGKSGFLVEGKPDEVAKRITELFDASKREDFGNKARETARKKFDWQSITDNYIRIYNSLLPQKTH